MAKTLKSNGGESPEGTAGAKHNVANLTKMIKECAEEMTEIKEDRKTLNARAGDIRKRITDAGQQPKALDFAVRLLEMDDEGREAYLESLKLNFEALSIGGQGDMFPGTQAEGLGTTPSGPPAEDSAKA